MATKETQGVRWLAVGAGLRRRLGRASQWLGAAARGALAAAWGVALALMLLLGLLVGVTWLLIALSFALAFASKGSLAELNGVLFAAWWTSFGFAWGALGVGACVAKGRSMTARGWFDRAVQGWESLANEAAAGLGDAVESAHASRGMRGVAAWAMLGQAAAKALASALAWVALSATLGLWGACALARWAWRTLRPVVVWGGAVASWSAKRWWREWLSGLEREGDGSEEFAKAERLALRLKAKKASSKASSASGREFRL